MGNRIYIECPKCGARGGCEKHGITVGGQWSDEGVRYVNGVKVIDR